MIVVDSSAVIAMMFGEGNDALRLVRQAETGATPPRWPGETGS